MLEYSSEMNRILAYHDALELIADMDDKSFHGDSWFDDIYDMAYGQEYEKSDADELMDDWIGLLDEAA